MSLAIFVSFRLSFKILCHSFFSKKLGRKIRKLGHLLPKGPDMWEAPPFEASERKIRTDVSELMVMNLNGTKIGTSCFTLNLEVG